MKWLSSYSTGACAQRRPEPKLRQHRDIGAGERTDGLTLNEGRSRNSGNTVCWGITRCITPTLNEGRSRNSGNTSAFSQTCPSLQSAQRRPEPKLRQHVGVPHPYSILWVRSTKAGAETPATLADDGRVKADIDDAQRRPEPKLRQHIWPFDHLLGDLGRSTKAGAETPATLQLFTWTMDLPVRAQRRPEPKLRQHIFAPSMSISVASAQRRPEPKLRQHCNVQPRSYNAAIRSTKAGAETPATHTHGRHLFSWTPSLNEGRSRNSGNTPNAYA